MGLHVIQALVEGRNGDDLIVLADRIGVGIWHIDRLSLT
jgi:hypothetical protein